MLVQTNGGLARAGWPRRWKSIGPLVPVRSRAAGRRGSRQLAHHQRPFHPLLRLNPSVRGRSLGAAAPASFADLAGLPVADLVPVGWQPAGTGRRSAPWWTAAASGSGRSSSALFLPAVVMGGAGPGGYFNGGVFGGGPDDGPHSTAGASTWHWESFGRSTTWRGQPDPGPPAGRPENAAAIAFANVQDQVAQEVVRPMPNSEARRPRSRRP